MGSDTARALIDAENERSEILGRNCTSTYNTQDVDRRRQCAREANVCGHKCADQTPYSVKCVHQTRDFNRCAAGQHLIDQGMELAQFHGGGLKIRILGQLGDLDDHRVDTGDALLGQLAKVFVSLIDSVLDPNASGFAVLPLESGLDSSYHHGHSESLCGLTRPSSSS